MERLIRFFVERHLLVNTITLAVVVTGLFAVMRTNVEGFPEATMPMFMITGTLPGAAAQDVETKITIPIEDELREVDGLESFTTIVTDNRSVTTVKLDDDTPDEDIFEKEREIRNAIEAINDFPPDMRDDPTVFTMDPSKMPVLEIAVAGEQAVLPDAARILKRTLLRLEGVGEVIEVGLPDPELRVLVDPGAARAHAVTILDVARAVERRNVSDTGGVLESAGDRRQVVMWGRYEDPSEVGETILRFDEGGPLRVRDVARIELGREDVGLIAGTNGRPGLSLVAVKKSDADMIDTRNEIAAALDTMPLPPGVTTTIVNDASYQMSNRLRVIASNGIMGLILVAGIVFLFLAPSAAIWVCVGVPLVILGVTALIPEVGLTINFVSTMAFVIVLGMLVDDAVVVAEKILLRRQEGVKPAEAAISGTLAVARPVIASAATTLLAFLPMLAIGGMPSKMVWQIPVVVSLALALSLLESFLILPPHMSMVRSDAMPRPKRQFMLDLEERYRRALYRTLPNRGKVAAVFAGIFLFIALVIAPQMQFEFFPQESAPGFSLKVRMPAGTPIEKTEAVADMIQAQIPPIMGEDLIAITTRVGHMDSQAFDREYGSSENEAVITMHLDLDKKRMTAAQWMAELQPYVRGPMEAELIFEAQVDGPPGLEPVNVFVLANDDQVRRQTALALVEFLEGLGGVTNLSVDEKLGMRQIDLNPDPERLARSGLDAHDLGLTLKASYYGLIASEMRDLEESTDIRVAFEPSSRRSIDALLDTQVRNSRGELVLLRDVVDPVEIPAVARIQHRNGLRAVSVTGGIDPNAGVTAVTIAEAIERDFLPRYEGRSDIELEISGEVVQSRRAMGDLGFVAIAVFFGIGAVIAIMLGSFLEAFFVIAVVPFAAMSVILTFWAHGMHFSLLPLIGTIGLSGVVVNASIVMVDSVHQAQHALDRGASESERFEVVVEAFVTRLRPVLVTSLSTFGGVLPTAYGFGGYDAVMSPMSLALGWGLALTSGVTLFLVPSLYVSANDINRQIDRWRRGRRPELGVAKTSDIDGDGPEEAAA